jgi:hypothetical protein
MDTHINESGYASFMQNISICMQPLFTMNIVMFRSMESLLLVWSTWGAMK